MGLWQTIWVTWYKLSKCVWAQFRCQGLRVIQPAPRPQISEPNTNAVAMVASSQLKLSSFSALLCWWSRRWRCFDWAVEVFNLFYIFTFLLKYVCQVVGRPSCWQTDSQTDLECCGPLEIMPRDAWVRTAANNHAQHTHSSRRPQTTLDSKYNKHYNNLNHLGSGDPSLPFA